MAMVGGALWLACSSQETKAPFDAGLPGCDPGPFIFCSPVGEGEDGCSTDDGSSPLLQRLPRGRTYAVGCTVNFVGERDEQGNCGLDSVCKCLRVAGTPLPGDAGGETPSTVAWTCTMP